MRRVVAAALSIFAIGCSSGNAAPTASIPAFSASEASLARLGVDAASEDLLARIDDASARRALEEHLSALSAALQARQNVEAARALRGANDVLTGMSRSERHAPLVVAIRESLETAHDVIDGAR